MGLIGLVASMRSLFVPLVILTSGMYQILVGLKFSIIRIFVADIAILRNFFVGMDVPWISQTYIVFR